MKITLLHNRFLLTSFLAFFFFSSQAQVGINTTTPSDGAMLDIESGTKGILIPRVDIADLSTIAPITGGSTESLLVYNTNTTTGKGFYFWNGSAWQGLIGNDWKLDGNTSTNPGTGAGQNFLGTTDAQNLVIATNGSAVATMSTAGQIEAANNGTAGVPSYTFGNDTDIGMYRSAANQLSFATNGTERLSILSDGSMRANVSGTAGNPLFAWSGDTDKGFYSAGADEFGLATNGTERFRVTNNATVFNSPQNDVNLRVATTGGSNTLFIDGANDNIGIGTSTPNGVFEMNSSTMGMIPPRVSLTSTLVEAPVVNPQGGSIVAGTCVYNINTAGTAPNNVAPGLYFWDGSRWVAFAGSPGGLDWTLTGNSGTTAGTNFLGTTDNVALEIFTNNTTRARMEEDGQFTVGFGASAANASQQMNVASTFTNGTAIAGYGTGTRYGLYGQNNSGSGSSIYGLATLSAASIIADNNSASGTGIIGSGANQGLNYFNNTGGSFNGTSLGATGKANSATGTGLSGLGNNSPTMYTLVGGSGIAGTGDTGAFGRSDSSTGTGIIGVGNNQSTSVTNPNGSGVAGTGTELGVMGYAGNGDVASANQGNSGGEFMLDADNDVTTNTGNNGMRARAKLAGFDNVTPDGSQTNRDSYFGGYFSGGSESSGTPSYAYVGMRYRTNANGDGVAGGGQDYKVVGTGMNSTIIRDSNNIPRVLFSPEAPEIVFQDFGVGQLINGEARIELDPILKSGIHVDAQHPLKVYVTLEGDCKGIYVTNKSADGFTVRELQGGTSNVSFSWQIVANRADTKDQNGRVVSEHVGIRLPVGPGPLKDKLEKVSQKAQKENSVASEIPHTIKENVKPSATAKGEGQGK